jgi:hypothetical protein
VIVSSLRSPLAPDVQQSIETGLNNILPAEQSLEAFNSSFAQLGSATGSRILAVARGLVILKHSSDQIEDLLFSILKDEAEASVNVSQSLLFI